jgi:chromosome partitioning protein
VNCGFSVGFIMKILCIANQKGGVGKSTLTVHLAYSALDKGLRVLLVDMDKQGSLSLTFEPSGGSTPGLLASRLYESSLPEIKPEIISDRLAIIRSDMGLLAIDKAENKVIRQPGQTLRSFDKDYDICLIDTPPLLGIRLMASLAASDFVLTPVNVGLYELAGLADLINTIHVVRTQGFNSRLSHIGILPMKTNNRSNDQAEALDMLRKLYNGAIMPECLPERAAVRKAITSRIPVWVNTSGSSHLKAASEWKTACNSVLSKVII